MNALQRVNFYGDTLEAQAVDGRVSVALRPMCAALGIAIEAQLRKLKGKPWACVTMMITHDSTGRRQELACLDLDAVPMWLATIEANKVKESSRGKLVRYQLEAARVLRDHFLPTAKPEPARPVVGLDIATGARVGENPMQRRELIATCTMLAKANRVPVATIHGMLRRAFSVPGVYLLPALVFPEAMRLLREVGLGNLTLPRRKAGKLLALPSAKQLDMWATR